MGQSSFETQNATLYGKKVTVLSLVPSKTSTAGSLRVIALHGRAGLDASFLQILGRFVSAGFSIDAPALFRAPTLCSDASTACAQRVEAAIAELESLGPTPIHALLEELSRRAETAHACGIYLAGWDSGASALARVTTDPNQGSLDVDGLISFYGDIQRLLPPPTKPILVMPVSDGSSTYGGFVANLSQALARRDNHSEVVFANNARPWFDNANNSTAYNRTYTNQRVWPAIRNFIKNTSDCL